MGLLLIIGLWAGCRPPADDQEGVVARVGDVSILTADLEAEVQRRRERGRPVPDKAGLLQEMIVRAALWQRAEEAGLNADPEVLQAIHQLLIGRLQDQELSSRIQALTVGDDEVQAEYEARLDRYTHPAKAQLAVLVLNKSSKMSEAKHEELRQRAIAARAKAVSTPVSGGRGPSRGGFGPLALEFSEDQASRYRGGDIGWLEVGRYDYRWPREVLAAGYALEVGTISEVIETDDGLYLIKKSDVRPATTTPLTEVRASLRQTLLTGKRQALEEAFRQETLQRFVIEIDEASLAAWDLSVPSPAKSGSPEDRPPALPGGPKSAPSN